MIAPKKTFHRLSLAACSMLIIAALSACSGGGSADTLSADTNGAAPTLEVEQIDPNAIVGVAATGAAIPDGAIVTVLSANGVQTTFTLNRGDGTFTVSPSGTGPFLLYVDHAGQRLYGFASATGMRANLTQLTDAIVRAALPDNYMDDTETIGQPLRVSQPLTEPGVNGGFLMKGVFNRTLYDCVPEGSPQADRDAWLAGTLELSEVEYRACLAKFDGYARTLQREVVNVRWVEFSALMASRMAAATAKVINALGVDDVRQVTAAIGAGNEVDLAAINPLNHKFSADQTRFDALLDRLKIERSCDNSSAACATTLTLYEDQARQMVKKSATQVYRFRDNFLLNEGSPAACKPDAPYVFDKPTGGQWGQVVSFRVRDQDSAAPATAEFAAIQSACAVQLDASTTPVASRESSVSASLRCSDFPVGQPSTATVPLLQFGSPLVLDFSERGSVISCTEFTNPDNLDDREITVTFDEGNPSAPEGFQQLNFRYLRMPID